MAHKAIGSRRSELQERVWLSAQKQPHLPQAEEVEVIDEEGRDQNQGPAEAEEREETGPPDRIVHGPDHAAQRAP